MPTFKGEPYIKFLKKQFENHWTNWSLVVYIMLWSKYSPYRPIHFAMLQGLSKIKWQIVWWGSPLPHKSDIHGPYSAVLAYGHEPGGICLCSNKTRFIKGPSRFMLKEQKNIHIKSPKNAPSSSLSPSSPWCFPLCPLDTLQLSVIKGLIAQIPNHKYLFCFDCKQLAFLVCLLWAISLLWVSGCGVLSGRKVLWVFLYFTVVNALVLAAWTQSLLNYRLP
jgi:hypothetical protein